MPKSTISTNTHSSPILASPNEGYVFDQVEGAIDTALFLAPLDIPIAIVGPRGTGKGAIGRLIHEARDGSAEEIEFLDCREFRGRASSLRMLSKAFESKSLKTLVFKSPHLLQAKVQEVLARCISSRTLVFKKPPKYLPDLKIVGLFPYPIGRLVREKALLERLASCFSAYPIIIPPLRERGHAVLRWADKILGQESQRLGEKAKGFSPDAQQAMLCHAWTGNISELRHRIVSAMQSTSREWLLPVDLGLKLSTKKINRSSDTGVNIFNEIDKVVHDKFDFILSAQQELEVAIKEWFATLDSAQPIPLGTWLHDELVLAAIDRYRGNQSKAAAWLQVPSRNVGRWLVAIDKRKTNRQEEKNSNDRARLVREWVREIPREGPPPSKILEEMILLETIQIKNKFDLAYRAGLFGVSTPTYRKKLKALEQLK